MGCLTGLGLPAPLAAPAAIGLHALRCAGRLSGCTRSVEPGLPGCGWIQANSRRPLIPVPGLAGVGLRDREGTWMCRPSLTGDLRRVPQTHPGQPSIEGRWPWKIKCGVDPFSCVTGRGVFHGRRLSTDATGRAPTNRRGRGSDALRRDTPRHGCRGVAYMDVLAACPGARASDPRPARINRSAAFRADHHQATKTKTGTLAGTRFSDSGFSAGIRLRRPRSP